MDNIGCQIWDFPGDCPQYGSAECPRTCSRFDEQAQPQEAKPINCKTECVNDATCSTPFRNPVVCSDHVKPHPQDDLREILLRNIQHHSQTINDLRVDFADFDVDQCIRDIRAAGYRRCEKREWPVLVENPCIPCSRARLVAGDWICSEDGCQCRVDYDISDAQREADRRHCPAQEGK